MQLAGLKSLHMASPEVPVVETPSAPFEGTPKYRNRSPLEELTARLACVEVERFPDELAAVMAHKIRVETVTPNGIQFDLDKVTYKYWHPNSATCHPQQLGKKVRIAFDREDLSVIHVLDDAGAYVETIPQKNKIAWFDPSMEKELADHRSVIAQVHNTVRRAQAGKTKKIVERTRKNAETLKYLHQFPAPAPTGKADAVAGGDGTGPITTGGAIGRSGSTEAATASADPRFPRAAGLIQAGQNFRQQKAQNTKRTATKKELADRAAAVLTRKASSSKTQKPIKQRNTTHVHNPADTY